MDLKLKKSHLEKVYLILIILGFISALVVLTGRIIAEKKNNRVELVLDYQELQELSARENIPLNQVLQKFGESGITSLSFNEMSLKSLEEEGKAQFFRGAQLKGILKLSSSEDAPLISINPGSLYIFGFTPGLKAAIESNLKLLYGEDFYRNTKISTGDGTEIEAIEIPSASVDFHTRGIGFNYELIEKTASLGFYTVLRPENRVDISSYKIKEYFNRMATLPKVTDIIFGGGNEVMGYPLDLDATVEGFVNTNISFGAIEVPNVKAQQKGSQYVGLKIPARTVRVQSINPQYLEKLRPENAIDIFRLGVRERNIRVLYLRPYPRALEQDSVLATNVSYVKNLKAELEKFGFQTGPASRFPLMNPHPVWIVLISFATVSAFMLILGCFKIESQAMAVVLGILTLVFVLGLIILGKTHLVQKIAGLAIGILFPVLAFTSNLEDMNSIKSEKKLLKIMGFALSKFVKITLVTIIGGLMIAALFASTTYMLAIDGFRGVKLVMVAPSLIILFLYYIYGVDPYSKFKNLMQQTLRYWQITVLVILGAAGLVLIMRSGNAADMLTSTSERQFRVMLENIFWVRPRFKDFMIGHPAMILTWGFYYIRQSLGLGLFILAGGIGQADIIDTFAHVHTPVFISLVRVISGAVLGTFIGVIFLSVFVYLKNKFGKHIQNLLTHDETRTKDEITPSLSEEKTGKEPE
ncbi:MAG: DUF5693 family protein [Vulcanimicrobiota bacterium]